MKPKRPTPRKDKRPRTTDPRVLRPFDTCWICPGCERRCNDLGHPQGFTCPKCGRRYAKVRLPSGILGRRCREVEFPATLTLGSLMAISVCVRASVKVNGLHFDDWNTADKWVLAAEKTIKGTRLPR